MIKWRFHHVGVITPDLKQSIGFYCDVFGYCPSHTFDDQIQQAKIVLLTRDDSPMIELICPTSPASPAATWLKRIQAGPYHTCYQVDNIDESLAVFGDRGLKLVFGPVPAVAFNGARVAFVWGTESGLLELVEPYDNLGPDS